MASNTTMTEATDTFDIPVIDPIISFATQMLCVGAVIAASSHTVKRWTAVKTLTPPELPKVGPKSEAAQPPRKGLKKVFNKAVLAKFVGPCIGLSVYFFFTFGIQMIKNRTVINSLWVGTLCLFYTIFFNAVTASFFHHPKTVSLVPQKLIPGYQLKFETQKRSKLWPLAAAVASAACAVSFYLGYQLAAPFMAATWTFVSISTFTGPRITARHMMMILNGYLIVCITLGALIGAIVTLFDSSNDDAMPSEPKQDTTVDPSMWVMELMTTMPSAFPAWVPGFMLALAMRFDHSRASSESVAVTKTAPGQSAAIPRSVASFPCPTFSAGLFALVVSVAGLKVLVQMYFPIVGTVTEMMYILITIPATTLGLVLGAWKQGQLKAWWLYEETWIPKVEKDEEAAKPDPETAAAEETEDEKTSLLQPSA